MVNEGIASPTNVAGLDFNIFFKAIKPGTATIEDVKKLVADLMKIHNKKSNKEQRNRLKELFTINGIENQYIISEKWEKKMEKLMKLDHIKIRDKYDYAFIAKDCILKVTNLERSKVKKKKEVTKSGKTKKVSEDVYDDGLDENELDTVWQACKESIKKIWVRKETAKKTKDADLKDSDFQQMTQTPDLDTFLEQEDKSKRIDKNKLNTHKLFQIYWRELKIKMGYKCPTKAAETDIAQDAKLTLPFQSFDSAHPARLAMPMGRVN